MQPCSSAFSDGGLRPRYIDPQLVDFLGFSELRALKELVKPMLRTYVTPEMVEKAVGEGAEREVRENAK